MLEVPWLVPTAGIFGACIVAATGYGVQRWRFKIDRLSVAADHLSSEINATADLSCKYWLLDCSQIADAKEARGLEPALIGRQTRIGALLEALEIMDRRAKRQQVDDLLVSLFDSLTGGDFKALHRAPDPGRAQSVHVNAAFLNGELKTTVALVSKNWI